MEILKNRKGYVAVETVIVAGLMIGIGMFSFGGMQESSDKITETSIEQIALVENIYDVSDEEGAENTEGTGGSESPEMPDIIPLPEENEEDKHFTIDINEDVQLKADGNFDFQTGTWTYSGNRKKVLTENKEFHIAGNGDFGQYSHTLYETTATFELDVKSITNGGASTGFNSVMLIRTGNTGLSVAFFPDKLVVGDNPFTPKLTYHLDASIYHTYRIVKDESKATVYVDGERIGSFTLANGTGYGQHHFFFGDGTSNSFPSETYYKNIRIAPGQALYLD